MKKPEAAPTETKTARPRSRWRWFWLPFKVLGVILLLAGIFHRPLAKWAINFFGHRAAEKAGLTSAWELSGNVFGGLGADQLNVVGKPGDTVQSISADKVELRYDLWELRKRGVGAVLQEVTVDRLNLELDLSKPPPAKEVEPKDSSKAPPELPTVFLPKVNISHVNLKIKLPNDTVQIEDFSLTLTPNGDGIIEWQKCSLPGGLEFQQVKGATRMTDNTLKLSGLQLTPTTLLETLGLDLAKLQDESVSTEVAAKAGGSSVKVNGTVSQWSTDLSADAKVQVANLASSDLVEWGVPAGEVTWTVPSLDLEVNGPVMKPAELQLKLNAAAGPIVAGKFTVDSVGLKSSAEGGKFELTNLSGTMAQNAVQVSGSVKLPATWQEVATVGGEMKFTADAKDLSVFAPDVKGGAMADGIVKFSNKALAGADAKIVSKELVVAGIPIASAEVLVNAVGQDVQLKKATVKLNDQNTVNVTGRLNLEGDRAFEAAWAADCADLSSIPQSVRGDVLWPNAGVVKTTGNASGTLANVQAKAWDKLNGKVLVDATGLQLKEAKLESLKLDASSQGGRAKLNQLAVTWDPETKVVASGDLALGDAALPFNSLAEIAIPDVTKVSQWGEVFGAPKLLGGAVAVHWKGAGKLKPMDFNGDGSVDVTGLRLNGVPEVLGASATVAHHGTEAEVTSLRATAGPWRAEGTAKWDGKRVTIPKLQGFAKDQLLVELNASAAAKYQDEPLELHLKVDQLDSTKLAAALGQKWPVTGVVRMQADFTGTLAELDGDLDTEISSIKSDLKEVAKLESGNLKLKATIKEGKLTAQSSIQQKPLEPLAINASLPLDIPALLKDPKSIESLPLQGSVVLPASSLASLPSFVPMVQKVNGTIAMNVTASGTVAHPKLDGGLTLNIPSASFKQENLPTVKDVNVKLTASQQSVKIETASMMVSGGMLQITGGAGIENIKDPTLNFKVNAEEILAVRDETISLRANANLACEGKVSAATVKGTIDLVRGRVFKEIEFLPLSLPNELPSPPASTTLGKSGPPTLPPPLNKWNFDIAIKTKDPIRLMGNVAHGSVVTDFKLGGTGEKLEFTGKADLQEAWVKLPFSRLTIRSGVVSFNKEQPFDPQIHVEGESIAGSYMVTLLVNGRALDPKLRFTSSPSLPEGEIATLLATGSTTNDLQSGDGEAAGRAIFFLLKSLYRKVIPKPPGSVEDDEPPRLTFELSGFSGDPKRRGVAAVYEFNPKWKAIGRVGDSGIFRGLLYYLIRFR